MNVRITRRNSDEDFDSHSLGSLTNRNDIRRILQLVQIIRPLLHHLPPFRKVRCSVISAPVRVSYRMS